MKKLPVGEATEMQGREAWDALVEYFGVEEAPTAPMPLEELPAPFELQPIEHDTWARVLNDLWSKTNAK